MATTHKQTFLRRGLRLPVQIIFAVIVLFSEIVRPLYRPVVDWVSNLSVVVRASDLIAAAPRGVILVLFAIPFAIAEPLKIWALVLIARGSLLSGLAIIVGAYMVSFLVVERIFHAGRQKLMTYAFIRWTMDRVELVRHALAEAKRNAMALVRAWLRKAAR